MSKEEFFWQIFNRIGLAGGVICVAFGAAEREPWKLIVGTLAVATLCQVRTPPSSRYSQDLPETDGKKEVGK